MIEFVPPVKNKSIFVVYIVEQNDGIVTASTDYIGDSDAVLQIGTEVLFALNSIAHYKYENLVVSNKISSMSRN